MDLKAPPIHSQWIQRGLRYRCASCPSRRHSLGTMLMLPPTSSTANFT